MANLRMHDIDLLPGSSSEDGGEQGRLSRRRKPRGRGLKEQVFEEDAVDGLIKDSQRVGLLAAQEQHETGMSGDNSPAKEDKAESFSPKG